MKKLVVGAVLLALSGCASNSPNQAKKVVKIDSAKNVWAKIKKDDSGEYFFSEFSFEELKDSINLNDLSNNYDKRNVRCRIGLASDEDNRRNNTVEICGSEKDLNFRYGTVDGGAIISNTLGNVVVAAMTMGFGTSAYYTSKFDYDELGKALKSAFSKVPREKLVSDFNAIHALHLVELQQKKLELEKKRTLLDSLVKNSTNLKDKTKMLETAPAVKVKVVKDLNNDLGNIGSWTSADDLTSIVRRNLKEKYDAVKLSVYCDDLRYYMYSVSGCGASWGLNDKDEVKPVSFVVEKLKSYKYYPLANASNSHLISKASQSGGVEFSNLTDSFLTIDSFSLYVDGKIETLSNIGIMLPPKSVNTEFSLSRFDSFNNSYLRNITKDDLLKEVEVGLAIKYKVVNTNMENTLYKVGKVKYENLPGKAILF